MSFLNDSPAFSLQRRVDFLESALLSNRLEGVRVLVLEDEFLIAMDVEQLCRDAGSAEVTIARSLAEVGNMDLESFDAAIVDVMLAGTSTLDFARLLQERGTPFVFASGYTDLAEITAAFPGKMVVGKPYAGDDLVEALANACGRG